jgi:hypothetical protein
LFPVVSQFSCNVSFSLAYFVLLFVSALSSKRIVPREILHYSVVRGRQTKRMDGRKKEPEILPLYY